MSAALHPPSRAAGHAGFVLAYGPAAAGYSNQSGEGDISALDLNYVLDDVLGSVQTNRRA